MMLRNLMVLFSLTFTLNTVVQAQEEFSTVENLQKEKEAENKVDFSTVENFNPFIEEEDIPTEIRELLSTESLPDLTPELVVQFLLENSPQKPEWILAKKLLKEQEKMAQAKRVKKYNASPVNIVVPFSVKSVEQILTLEPNKYSIIEIIDANGKPWPVSLSKASNDKFVILGDSEIPTENKSSRNHIIINASSDYEESDLRYL